MNNNNKALETTTNQTKQLPAKGVGQMDGTTAGNKGEIGCTELLNISELTHQIKESVDDELQGMLLKENHESSLADKLKVLKLECE